LCALSFPVSSFGRPSVFPRATIWIDVPCRTSQQAKGDEAPCALTIYHPVSTAMLAGLFALPHLADLETRLGRIWSLEIVYFERDGQIIGPAMGPTFCLPANVGQALDVSFPRLSFPTSDYHLSLAENLREILRSALPSTRIGPTDASSSTSGVTHLRLSFDDHTSPEGDIIWDPDALLAIVSAYSLTVLSLHTYTEGWVAIFALHCRLKKSYCEIHLQSSRSTSARIKLYLLAAISTLLSK
jgi:hypothetical protein